MVYFIDIETSSGEKELKHLSKEHQEIYLRRYAAKEITFTGDKELDFALNAHYTAKAALIPEFGRVTCISVGATHRGKLMLKSFYGSNEKTILSEFAESAAKWHQNNPVVWCGHNIKHFDIPYLCKRMLANQVDIPNCINFAGKKPWEVNAIDTMEQWKFGGSTFISLEVLCMVLGVPSPKGVMDGEAAAGLFWEKRTRELSEYKDIAKYCEGDVIATARCAARLVPDLDIQFKEISTELA